MTTEVRLTGMYGIEGAVTGLSCSTIKELETAILAGKYPAYCMATAKGNLTVWKCKGRWSCESNVYRKMENGANGLTLVKLLEWARKWAKEFKV